MNADRLICFSMSSLYQISRSTAIFVRYCLSILGSRASRYPARFPYLSHWKKHLQMDRYRIMEIMQIGSSTRGTDADML